MSSSLVYRGYAACIEFSSEDECFIGHIAGIKDVVGFHGESVTELKTAFEDAVNGYLEVCNKVGKEPQKPYSGKLMLRIRPETHAAIATAAELSGQSINQWASEALNREAGLKS
jgi:predicted HicB family RNase H-like nuclease